jgi:uncharacterized protein (DUF362 family)
MIIVASLEAVALVAIVVLMLRHQAASEVAWTAERRELLTRIQRPEHVPTAQTPAFEWPVDDESDEIELVGTIAEPQDEAQ